MLQAQSTKAGETALAGAVEFFRGCWFGVWFFGGNCCDWGQDLLLGFQLEIHSNILPNQNGYLKIAQIIVCVHVSHLLLNNSIRRSMQFFDKVVCSYALGSNFSI